jgi:hypothetical protein
MRRAPIEIKGKGVQRAFYTVRTALKISDMLDVNARR